MITLNGKKFARTNKEFTDSLFDSTGTCVGYYIINKRVIKLYDMQKKQIGIINQELVLGSATEVEGGRMWYSYRTPDIIGEYDSYVREKTELGELAVGRDRIGYYFK